MLLGGGSVEFGEGGGEGIGRDEFSCGNREYELVAWESVSCREALGQE